MSSWTSRREPYGVSHSSVAPVAWFTLPVSQFCYLKLEIADYHVSEALEAIPRVLPKDNRDKRTAAWAMQFALMSGLEEGDAMAIAQRETEAHAIAAAQALN